MSKKKFLQEAQKIDFEKIGSSNKTQPLINNTNKAEKEFVITFKSTMNNRKKLKMIRSQTKISIKDLINEALEDLFKKYKI